MVASGFVVGTTENVRIVEQSAVQTEIMPMLKTQNHAKKKEKTKNLGEQKNR